MTSFKKGDVILIPFPFSESPLESKKRPALVVQNNRNNERLQTLIIAQITSNTMGVGKEPTQMLVKKNHSSAQTGLASDSAIKCENLATVSKKKILKKLGSLPQDEFNALDKCLKAAFGIVD